MMIRGTLVFSFLALTLAASCTREGTATRTRLHPVLTSDSVSGEFDAADPVPWRKDGFFQGGSAHFGNGQILYVWEQVVRTNGRKTIFGQFHDLTGVPQGTSFPVAPSLGAQTWPAAAFDGTNWVVAWTDENNASEEIIKAARITPEGESLDPDGVLLVTDVTFGQSVAIASNGTGTCLIVSLGGSTDTRATIFHSNGTAEPSFEISDERSPRNAVAFDGTNFLVAYGSAGAGQDELHARRISTAGTIIDTSPIVLGTTDDSWDMHAASNGTSFIVGRADEDAAEYYIVGSDGTPGATSSVATDGPIGVAAVDDEYLVSIRNGLGIDLLRLSEAGANLGTSTIATTGIAIGHDLTSLGSSSFLVYELGFDADPGDSVGVRLAKDLTVLDDPPHLVGSGSTQMEHPSVTRGGDIYFAVWQDWRNWPDPEIYGSRISPIGEVLDPEGIPISDGFGQEADVAFNGTDFLVVYRGRLDELNDIAARRISAEGVVLDATPLEVSNTDRWEARPHVASDGTDWLVIWDEGNYGGGATRELNGRVVGADGTIGGQVTYSDRADVEESEVAFNGTHYLVASRTVPNILGKRVTPNGSAVDATPIDLGDGGSGRYKIGIATDGTDWLVTWAHSSGTVYANHLSASGTVAHGTGLEVTTGAHVDVSLAYSDGRYWTTYWSGIPDNLLARVGIHARELGLDGTPMGTDDIIISEEHFVHGANDIAGGPTGPLLSGYTRADPSPGYGTSRVKLRFIGSEFANGTPCDFDASCASGQCLDGFCGSAVGTGGSGGATSTGGTNGDGDSTGDGDGDGDSSGNGDGDGDNAGSGDGDGDSSSAKEHSSDDGGCGCRLERGRGTSALWLLSFLLLAPILRRYVRVTPHR